MVRDSIFVATLVSFKVDHYGRISHDTKRAGWYKELGDLYDNLKKSGESLVECRWSYLVIENSFDGLGYCVKQDWEVWMKFNDENKLWEKCAKPKGLEGTICWCI